MTNLRHAPIVRTAAVLVFCAMFAASLASPGAAVAGAAEAPPAAVHSPAQAAAVTNRPDPYVEKLNAIRDLRLAGETGRAMELVKPLLEKNPDDVDALVQRGFCRLRDGRELDLGLGDFLRAVSLAPRYIDAYIGAAIIYRRQGKRNEAENTVIAAEKACGDDARKLRYLATTAWREGYFPLARRLDRLHKTEPGRVLIDEPWIAGVRYSYCWVVDRTDWSGTSISLSKRLRPDITLGCSMDWEDRYAMQDWQLGFSGSYRHKPGMAFSLSADFSDESGFLADRACRISTDIGIARETTLGLSESWANYSEGWSDRTGISLTRQIGNFWAKYGYSFGQDSDRNEADGHSVSIGYGHELDYDIALSYSDTKEFVEIPRGEDFIFRSDRVQAFSARCRYYISETFGISAGYSRESRRGDLFRREASVSVFKRF